MKTIIVEGLDRVGKNTLIKGICDFYEYDNVHVRHCGKPPRSVQDPFKWQMFAFMKEGKLSQALRDMELNEYGYFDNKLIFNRYYPGEYVYGIMYRGYTEEFISEKIRIFESQFVDLDTTYLITLIADPDFLMRMEDGKSFATSVGQKEKEVKLFKEVHNLSSIRNKMLISVDENGGFLPKEKILNGVLNFIK